MKQRIQYAIEHFTGNDWDDEEVNETIKEVLKSALNMAQEDDEYYQPRDIDGQQWFLYFEDPDHPNEYFGKFEKTAKERFEQANARWSCVLFQSAPHKPAFEKFKKEMEE